MDKYYFRQVDRWIYNFAMIVSDPEWDSASATGVQRELPWPVEA
jgi:hypothetical protein